MLLSPTLRSIIEPVIYDRYLRIELSVGHVISLADLDKCNNIEMHLLTFPTGGIKECTYLQSLFSLLQLSLTEYQALTVQYCFVFVLIETAFQSTSLLNCNRKLYRFDRLICNF